MNQFPRPKIEEFSYNNDMKITIETKDNRISMEVPDFNGSTTETWEKQGYDIFKKCVEYIFKKEQLQ